MDYQIPELKEEVEVEVTEGEVKGIMSLKDLINVIIAFINKLLKFEF